MHSKKPGGIETEANLKRGLALKKKIGDWPRKRIERERQETQEKSADLQVV